MRADHLGRARQPTTGATGGHRVPVAAARVVDRVLRRRRDEEDRDQLLREHLIRRLAASGPLPVVRLRTSRFPIDRCRLSLLDGSEIRARLLWQPAGTPVAVSALRWWDDIGWEIKVVDARGETLTWYAWHVLARTSGINPTW